MSDVTRILTQIEQGDPEATDKLLPLIYDKLRTVASGKAPQQRRADLY